MKSAKTDVGTVQPYLLLNLSSDELEKRNFKGAEYRGCADFLSNQVTTAKIITIVSAFYGIDFLFSLLTNKEVKHRGGREVRILVGRAAPPALPGQKGDLETLKQRLIGRGYKKGRVHIRLAPDGRFFHSKLYQFQSGNRRVTLIGSANASERGFGSNDEVLVAITGRNATIDNYVTQTWRVSVPIEEMSKVERVPAELFEYLLRDGLLYFQPPRALSASIDCFPDHKYPKIVSTLKKQGNRLPFTDQGSVTSINILDLLSIEIDDALEEQNVASSFHMPRYSVQTVFGYWVPSTYEKRLESLIDDHARLRRSELSDLGAQLSDVSRSEIAVQLKIFFDAVDRRLNAERAAKLSQDQKEYVLDRVAEKVKRLALTLTNEQLLDRLSRRFIGTPVPELWEDQRSKQEFKESFCDYVASRMASAGKKPAIVSHLANRFRLSQGDDPQEVRDRIDRFFITRKWAPDDWPKLAQN